MVLVCQILKRQLGKYLRTQRQVDTYNQKVRITNDYLKTVSSEHAGVKYWRHRGLTNPDQSQATDVGPALHDNGVHMSPRGQYKFYKSIRGAVKFAMNNC